MPSKEAHWGRYWFPIGTGAWDPQGRPSQVRLDLLIVAPGDVRREGATVDRSTYNAVCDALRQHGTPNDHLQDQLTDSR